MRISTAAKPMNNVINFVRMVSGRMAAYAALVLELNTVRQAEQEQEPNDLTLKLTTGSRSPSMIRVSTASYGL
jgi:hypothetical protein